LELADYRCQVSDLYAAVRAEPDPARGHQLWRERRDELFQTHPQSPLPARDPLRSDGLPYWPYDPSLRFELALDTAEPEIRAVETGEGTISLSRIGRLQLPPPLDASLDVWWLDQYAGGLFIPLRDGTAGHGSYGGGRYLLDTAKGSYLGGDGARLVIDLNFAYHPSCRYDGRWVCPLAPAGNTITAPVTAGEKL
jgi:uncharacterized protein (DUF1684 family)